MTARIRQFERIADLPILLVHAPAEGRKLVARLRSRPFRFLCAVAHTDTSEIPDISAAGETPALRRLTAAADAEALRHGRPRCMQGVPSNPRGAPGPVIITLAGLGLAGVTATVFDVGLRVRPDAPTVKIDRRWGASIVSGRAVPHAAELFERGYAWGEALARESRDDYLVVSESVPGGTTTALSLLCGLGIDAWGKVSGSMPGNVHRLKERVVREALAAASLDAPRAQPRTASHASHLSHPTVASCRSCPSCPTAPLGVTAAVGDPMQPFVAGLALAAHLRLPVLLAGGSQMAAVLALALQQAAHASLPVARENLAVVTTGWVARDPAADLAGLARQVAAPGSASEREVPFLASDVPFGGSRHASLRRYEDFLVKEGVGAGAALVAAALKTGADRASLLTAVEAVYDDIYGSGSEDMGGPDTITR